jgi:hypothetical protein
MFISNDLDLNEHILGVNINYTSTLALPTTIHSQRDEV